MAFHVMAKPAGPNCNLRCEYCFYLEKHDVLGLGAARMDDELLERFIRQRIESGVGPEVEFAWQGGEPTLAGLPFFRRVVELQRKHAGGRRVTNAFQTNGTRLDDQWAAFFGRHRFLVGISIDGPKHLHDAFRRSQSGRPTFDEVMRGVGLLKRHRVEFNALTTVHRKNSGSALEIYRFLVDEVGARHLQFIPIVEREVPAPGGPRLFRPGDNPADARVTDTSVAPRDYGDFLIRIFDHWVQRDVGRVYVQSFDNALANWVGAPGAICVHSEACGNAVALEANGDVFSCDHYVYPEYRLGNIRRASLPELLASPIQESFRRLKREALPAECRRCAVRFACHGGCPKHRFLPAEDGRLALNYLCEGYRKFFSHVEIPMQTMAALLRAKRAPAEIMRMLHRPAPAAAPAMNTGIPSSARCPCGSGRHFGACCGA